MSLLAFTRRSVLRIAGVALVTLLALLVSTRALYAGTITIVDGPNTPPASASDPINDAFIQDQLENVGSVTINTDDSTAIGPDEIRIDAGVDITWTSNAALFLFANESIIVSGTIQHDGPTAGNGGVFLQADNDANGIGDVVLGLGGQTSAIRVGSRFGQTHVEGANVRLQAANGGSDNPVQIGFHATNQGNVYNVTGSIWVTGTVAVVAQAGDRDLNYIQIGNGGASSAVDTDADGNFAGDITIVAGEEITFTAGSAVEAYAQVGNGGSGMIGDHSGSHSLTAQNGDITFTGGTAIVTYAQVGNGGANADAIFGVHSGNHILLADGDISFTAGSTDESYAQVGNGGYEADGSHSGDHSLITANGDVSFTGGGNHAYAQVGNGGRESDAAIGGHSGNHTFNAGSDINFTAGNGIDAYAQVGNGGFQADGDHTGIHSLDAGDDISFTAGSAPDTYAQVGNGGAKSTSTGIGDSGDMNLTAVSNITFTAGSRVDAYAQVGNGGNLAQGNHSGNHMLIALNGDIFFTGGGDKGSYAQVGNGGYLAEGNHSGNHTLTAQNDDITFNAGGGQQAYAQVGNGGLDTNGNHSGNHTLTAHNGDIIFTGGGDLTYAQVGNGGFSSDGDFSGTLELTAAQNISLTNKSGIDIYTQIGHGAGSDASFGTRSGNITILAGEDLLLHDALIGHYTDDSGGLLDGDTLIGVSQNNPYTGGSGQIIASSSNTFGATSFNSAFAPNGELRFYVPEAANVSIDANTGMNSELFPGSVPANRLAGFHLFADGPYIAGADYAFYFAGLAVVLTKTVGLDAATCATAKEIGVAPGTRVTYCYEVTNTGAVTLTQHTLLDSEEGLLLNNFFYSLVPGASAFLTVTTEITQTTVNTATWTASNPGPTDMVSATDSATVTVVAPPNTPPVANGQTVNAVQGQGKAITLTASDSDGDPLTFTVLTQPAHGTLSGSAPNLSYSANVDFVGEDSITFKVNDGKVDSPSATVTITVAAPPNTPPVANAQTVNAVQGQGKVITLSGSDADGDTLTFIVVSQPANGTLIGSAPNLTYTSNAGFTGQDTFTFKVNDNKADSPAATVTINVAAAPNIAPVANAQTINAVQGVAKSITLTGTDADGDKLTFTVVSQPANGALTGATPNLTYTSNAAFTGQDTFTFKVNDGTVDSPAATVTINVTAAPVENTPPVANAQTVNAVQGQAKAITLTGSDTDSDTLTFTVVAQPTNGTLSGTAPNLIYTSTAAFTGEDSFTFKVNDGTVDSATATVTINVAAPPNTPPVADAQTVNAVEGVTKTITLTGSDEDDDTLTFTILTQPANGTLSGTAPNLTYAPNPGFTGEDTFTFKVSDGTVDSPPVTVTIVVESDEPIDEKVELYLPLARKSQQPTMQ